MTTEITRDQARTNFRQAVKENNPRKIATATLELLMTDETKMRQLSKETWAAIAFLDMDYNHLLVWKKYITEMTKIKRQEYLAKQK